MQIRYKIILFNFKIFNLYFYITAKLTCNLRLEQINNLQIIFQSNDCRHVFMTATENKGFKCSLRDDRVDLQEKAPKPIRTRIRNTKKKNNFNNYLNNYM